MEEEKNKRYELFEEINPREIFVTKNKKYVVSVVTDTKYGTKLLNIKEFVRYVNPKTGKPINKIFYPVKGGGSIKLQIDENNCVETFFEGLIEYYDELKKSKPYKRISLGLPTIQKAIFKRHAVEENREKANAKRRQHLMFE